MATHVEADIEVKRFGFTSDGDGNRLLFPQAHMQKLEGRSGSSAYGATNCGFDDLEGRLDMLRWKAAAASVGAAWLRDDAGHFDLAAERTEFPHGLMLVRADHGIELVSQHVSFSELRLTITGPFAGSTSAAPPPDDTVPAMRQERLRFLDSLSGRIYLTVNVKLDLPVLGVRSLDQQLRVPIQEGSLDYHALEKGLDWLEGRFLDINYDDNLLRVQWKVPIFGSSHDLITWPLDQDAATLAAFGRVPVRSLTDFRIPSSDDHRFASGDHRSASGDHRFASGDPKPDDNKKRKVLQALAIDAIDVALSLLAPRNLEVGGGMIMFGGDDQPGLVDLKVTGAISDRGPGSLHGAIGSIDTTIKDLKIGPLGITADRLTLDGLDQLEVTFDGFRPTAITLVAHRATATNLSIKIGS